jgi:MFS family permease
MAETVKAFSRRSFAALAIRNYRLYFIGQGISQSGTWLQMVAQTWLVLQLTHSGTMLGIVSAAQFLPMLLFGPYGGLLADRQNKYRLLFVTQGLAMLQAVVLLILVATHVIEIWMIIVLAASLGMVNAIDNPLRQTFVLEMVGKQHLTNAITLNSMLVNLARVIGPLIAAVLIASVGIKWCFLVNAISYVAVLSCLRLMRVADLHVGAPVKQAKGQLKEGFRYIWQTPLLRNVLIMMTLVGGLAYEFPVSLPLFATFTFHGTAGTYSLMLASMSAGSLLGGVIVAGRGNPSPRRLLVAALAFGVAMLLLAVSPNRITALLVLLAVGYCSINFNTLGNSTLQLNSSPEMRGRVMALWTVAFLGSTPIGGPIIGYVSEHTNPRVGLAVGGVAALAAGLFGITAARSYRQQQVAKMSSLELADNSKA